MTDDVPDGQSDEQAGEVPAGEPVGWRVIDPDGNVVDSGPGMVLEMVTEMGDQGEAG
jgi:hypothetical protein